MKALLLNLADKLHLWTYNLLVSAKRRPGVGARNTELLDRAYAALDVGDLAECRMLAWKLNDLGNRDNVLVHAELARLDLLLRRKEHVARMGSNNQ